MDLVYDDEALLEKKEAQLREANPEIGELAAVSAETAAALDETSQKLFAELCYSRLSGEFDRMKQAHRPLYLYSFMVFGDEMFIYVTGKLEDEKRISEGGELFELGFTSEYQTGAYPVADRILSTGKPVNDMELSRAKGADRSVVHTFEPVYANGQLKAIVGVSIRSREMLKQILVMMRTMLLITIAFFTVMILIVVHHIRKIVVIPINKEKEILEDYERDKDSASASKLLATINTHNEIERMANSFSSMVTELDRYMEEIKSVTAEKERIGAELNVATKIQADMLPRKFPAFPDRNEFDLYATMTPAKEVGGDFYDFFLVDDDHIMLVMADVSGKGVPAALFMVIAKTLIKNHAMLGGTPSTVLARTNDQLCEHNEAELFVTVWIALIEISTGKGIAANAGHEHPVIKHAGGDWELIEYRHSPPVATMEGVKFKEHEFEIHPGDSLYVYTDGVAEATDSNNELFGTERMLDVLNANKDASPKELLEAVKAGIDDFVGDAPQFDDITMMCFDYTGKQ
ncbi:MAG: PP2C family protein-serine/threonine phosphatase [Lachnospiraceae bacterium]|nr:PP2C family protein-serine/threonine phosphatase [Lachnospiraceae bacterium]